MQRTGRSTHCPSFVVNCRPEKKILGFLNSAKVLADQPRAIVPLQPLGTRPPVFAVAGHNGDVFCYRALAQHLGDDQPFFGLQPPGADGQSQPLTSVEDLAAYFASQIRAFQPNGPYLLAGYCAGGTIAFELARQLFGGRCDGAARRSVRKSASGVVSSSAANTLPRGAADRPRWRARSHFCLVVTLATPIVFRRTSSGRAGPLRRRGARGARQTPCGCCCGRGLKRRRLCGPPVHAWTLRGTRDSVSPAGNGCATVAHS